MAIEWAIFLGGGALGYFLRGLIDNAACVSCREAIRYREDLVKQKEVAWKSRKGSA